MLSISNGRRMLWSVCTTNSGHSLSSLWTPSTQNIWKPRIPWQSEQLADGPRNRRGQQSNSNVTYTHISQTHMFILPIICHDKKDFQNKRGNDERQVNHLGANLPAPPLSPGPAPRYALSFLDGVCWALITCAKALCVWSERPPKFHPTLLVTKTGLVLPMITGWVTGRREQGGRTTGKRNNAEKRLL